MPPARNVPWSTRKALRLLEFDYGSPNAYFVTITTHHRRAVLAHEQSDRIELTRIGICISESWLSLGTRFPSIGSDEFVVMPDHFHAIVFLDSDSGVAPVGAGLARPERRSAARPSLGRVIGAFKSLTTVAVNRMTNNPGLQLWQRGYYDRVIRDEVELTAVREYIRNNPDALMLSRLWE